MTNEQKKYIKIGLNIIIEKNLLIKNFIIIICLSLINILFMPFISSFIHELSHFIMAKVFGFSDVRLIVYYPYGGGGYNF